MNICLTGREKAREDEKEKLVGSLMFLKKGHRRISSFEESDSPARSLARSLKQKFMSETKLLLPHTKNEKIKGQEFIIHYKKRI